jgi:hypothetical protein
MSTGKRLRMTGLSIVLKWLNELFQADPGKYAQVVDLLE